MNTENNPTYTVTDRGILVRGKVLTTDLSFLHVQGITPQCAQAAINHGFKSFLKSVKGNFPGCGSHDFENCIFAFNRVLMRGLLVKHQPKSPMLH